MQNDVFKRQEGVSILELIIVLVIIMVATAMAVSRFDRSQRQLQRQNIARELKVFLDRARFDSINRRAEGNERALVTLENAASFSVTMDFNQDGTLNTATEKRTLNFAGSNGGSFVGISSFPVNIYFDRHGHAVDSGNSMLSPSFTICNENCAANSSNPASSTLVTVSSTGTVITSPGGYGVASPSPPAGLSNAPANTNPLVRVPAGSSSH